jgi:hypothetical protein
LRSSVHVLAYCSFEWFCDRLSGSVELGVVYSYSINCPASEMGTYSNMGRHGRRSRMLMLKLHCAARHVVSVSKSTDSTPPHHHSQVNTLHSFAQSLSSSSYSIGATTLFCFFLSRRSSSSLSFSTDTPSLTWPSPESFREAGSRGRSSSDS